MKGRSIYSSIFAAQEDSSLTMSVRPDGEPDYFVTARKQAPFSEIEKQMVCGATYPAPVQSSASRSLSTVCEQEETPTSSLTQAQKKLSTEGAAARNSRKTVYGATFNLLKSRIC